MKKAYMMIFTNYCTKGIQQRVEEHPNFKGEIEDDPIKLLESIKSLTHEPVRAQYPLIAVTDSFIRWINGRQYDDEDLVDYVKRFKQQRDIVKSQLGKDFLHDFFKKTVDEEVELGVQLGTVSRDLNEELSHRYPRLEWVESEQSNGGSRLQNI